MRNCRTKSAFLLASLSLLGCEATPHRPANVPASATWIDNVFINCSVEKAFRANQCTVYKGGTGEILADGLFVLRSDEPVSKSDLRYAAFGEKGIFLEDLRILYQRTASERDPSHRLFSERLKSIASKDGTTAVDCGQVITTANIDTVTECILSAFAQKKSFFASYYQPGLAHFGYNGLAGDSTGTVYGAFYSSGETVWTGGAGKDGQIVDGNHTLILPCPKPTNLSKSKAGILTCFIEVLEAHPAKPNS
jgi:hypothetical protein